VKTGITDIVQEELLTPSQPIQYLPSTSDPSTASTPLAQQSPNLFAQVQDFNHLKASVSPNFSLLPPEDVVPDEVWRDVVPGGPGWSLNDILKGVGIVGNS
jgi:hypothetical protein